MRYKSWAPLAPLQVVEIASLTEHLLTDCDKKDSFGRCHRCSEALPKDELPKHLKNKTCNREYFPTGRLNCKSQSDFEMLCRFGKSDCCYLGTDCGFRNLSDSSRGNTCGINA